ncbi:hypothetical protein CONLIGDRAFT_632562 [Coniochaeta ligniaria NRRL 30616]|uniref:Uncharacterized protein n=1 Tax=Coniochaeta ligniaria NRRL 30616 TaxID=1408157 RepID=A0A1J7ILG1_9PEZI|nr:hypothetical protein CONLIGDRAFT_632562 [Coniochaeta ligniaria NRRL 30616]
MSKATMLKEEGNRHFQAGDFVSAEALVLLYCYVCHPHLSTIYPSDKVCPRTADSKPPQPRPIQPR